MKQPLNCHGHSYINSFGHASATAILALAPALVPSPAFAPASGPAPARHPAPRSGPRRPSTTPHLRTHFVQQQRTCHTHHNDQALPPTSNPTLRKQHRTPSRVLCQSNLFFSASSTLHYQSLVYDILIPVVGSELWSEMIV